MSGAVLLRLGITVRRAKCFGLENATLDRSGRPGASRRKTDFESIEVYDGHMKHVVISGSRCSGERRTPAEEGGAWESWPGARLHWGKD